MSSKADEGYWREKAARLALVGCGREGKGIEGVHTCRSVR